MKRLTIAAAIFLTLLTGCSSYQETVQPIKIPQYQSKKVEVNGAYIIAEAYVEPKIAKEKFGFDIRGAGIIPVQVVIQNNGNHTILIDEEQTFLIDEKGQGWPLLSFEQVYNRIKDKVEIGEAVQGAKKPSILGAAAGAIIGAAIAIVSGENVGKATGKGAAAGAAAGILIGGAQSMAQAEEKIKDDLTHKTLRNRVIAPKELVHGFLFFPGRKEEAQSVKVLRLALRFDNSPHPKIVEIPLKRM